MVVHVHSIEKCLCVSRAYRCDDLGSPGVQRSSLVGDRGSSESGDISQKTRQSNRIQSSYVLRSLRDHAIFAFQNQLSDQERVRLPRLDCETCRMCLCRSSHHAKNHRTSRSDCHRARIGIVLRRSNDSRTFQMRCVSCGRCRLAFDHHVRAVRKVGWNVDGGHLETVEGSGHHVRCHLSRTHRSQRKRIR